MNEPGDRRRGAGVPETPLSLSSALADAWPEISGHPDELTRRELIGAQLFRDPDGVIEEVKVGRFALRARLGTGAMGVVYEAYDHELGRNVAIKLLHAELSTPDRCARLQREAQALARLSHANVIAIHDVGEWQGQLFLAMEFVPGSTLAVWQCAKQRTWREIINVYVQAGHGLAAAHAAGLVHRDFKPANALIGDDGRVRVVDFGLVGAELSKADEPADAVPAPASTRAATYNTGPSALDVDLTATRAALGTPAYMAPEQFESARVDGRADQFSFCVALYEALYGRRPFDSGDEDMGALLDRIQRGPPAMPANSYARIPRRLYRIVQRGLSTDARDRYPFMTTLLADLERLANASRRRRRLALLVLAAVVVVAVVAGALRWSAERLERERAQTRCARAVAAAEKIAESDSTHAHVLLRDAPCADDDPIWTTVASGVLQLPVASTVLRGRPGRGMSMAFSPDGRILAASGKNDITEIWRRGPDGSMPPDPALVLPGERFKLSGHGDQVLTLSRDGIVRVWDLSHLDATVEREPVPLVSLDNELSSSDIKSLAFLPDEAGVFWLTRAGMLRVWRPDQGNAWTETALAHGLAHITRVRLLADGRYTILMGDHGEFELWRINGLPFAAEHHLSDRSCPARTAYMAPSDVRYLYIACDSGVLERWDLDEHGPPEVWRGHSGPIIAMKAMPDGRVFTVALDRTVRAWTPGSELHSDVMLRHDSLFGTAFSPDGQRVLTISSRQAQVLELSSTRDVTILHSVNSMSPEGAWSPDGRYAAVASDNGLVRVWDLQRNNSHSLRGHEQGIWSAELSPDGAWLATASFDGTVRRWDLSGREPPRVFRGHCPLESKPACHVYAARFDARGERIASGAADGTARIRRADGRGEPTVLPGHEVWAYALAWSPDDQWLATGSQTGAVRLWPASGGEPVVLASPTLHSDHRIHDLAFSPDGARLVAERGIGLVQMWHLSKTPPEMTEFQGPQWIGHAVAFSPDGRILAASDGSAARLFDGRDLTELAVLEGHQGMVYDLDFSPDGRRLITASDDGTTRVWRTDGQLEHTLYGNTAPMITAAFDPAGERVVTGSGDGIVRVWRLSTPDTPIVLRGHSDAVRFVAFTPDGERVVSASMDSTARVWTVPAHLDGASLRRQLRAATTACLSPGRLIQYLGESEADARRHTDDCVRRMTSAESSSSPAR